MMLGMAEKAGARAPKKRKPAQLKTQVTGKSVEAFLGKVGDAGQREDAFRLLALMKKATKKEPKMWGAAIVGFGDHRFESPSGRIVDWFLVGFSPRKNALTIYLSPRLQNRAQMLEGLGKFKTSGGCLYVRRLEDVNEAALSRLIAASVASLFGKS